MDGFTIPVVVDQIIIDKLDAIKTATDRLEEAIEELKKIRRIGELTVGEEIESGD